MADAFGYIDLPKLQSLTLIDLSIALPRINAPSLRNVTVCNMYLGMSQGTAGGVSSNPRVEAAARETVLGFLLRSAKSLESAQLHARVVLEKDIAARSSPTDSSHTIFPRLTSMSLCLDDYISELIDAPNLRHLEIRQPLDERGPHPDHSRFATAETLVLADTSTLDVVWAGTNSMKNVRQLQIRRDPSQLGRLNEIFFCVRSPRHAQRTRKWKPLNSSSGFSPSSTALTSILPYQWRASVFKIQPWCPKYLHGIQTLIRIRVTSPAISAVPQLATVRNTIPAPASGVCPVMTSRTWTTPARQKTLTVAATLPAQGRSSHNQPQWISITQRERHPANTHPVREVHLICRRMFMILTWRASLTLC